MAIRSANTSDAEAILSILRETACQVPVNLSTSEHVRAIKEQIIDCCLGGFSLVAVEDSGAVVGFQLAQERTADDARYIYLVYAGVTAAARGKKVFRHLIEAEKQHKTPLVAEVKLENKSHMAERLKEYGFEPFCAYNIVGNLRWEPK
jgi:L-amino acid N-acyltransferase YncA